MRILVAFYSYEGNTKLIAQTIAKTMDADLLEIKPEKEMGSKGMMKFLWGGSQVYMKKKPKLKPFDKNPSEYDIIFIGTPIWAWTHTPAIRTFMEDHLPTGKKMAFFCSNEGNVGKAFKNMTEMAKGNEIIGSMDFFAPLKKDKERTLENARSWALSITPALK